jgi:S-adenosylmethionine-dependent methyltransferase
MPIPFDLHRRIPLVRRPFFQRDQALRERDRAYGDLAEAERAHQEVLQQVRADQQEAVRQREQAMRDREQAMRDREQAMRDRDEAIAERERLLETDPWRKRVLPPEKERILAAALPQALASMGYFDASYFSTDAGQEVIESEVQSRLFWFRRRYVRWLASVISLDGARILEIGAGTGNATIPLAEKGALVDAVDVNQACVEVARLRAELHGLEGRVQAHCANAAEIAARFGKTAYDMVVYFAALEHMTYQERLTTLEAAWGMLRAGALLCIADTPNRLWYFDNHTSFANFFHWLPDEMAMDYAAKVDREGFNTAFRSRDAASPEKLARWGRGVSYHEFELAIGPLDGLCVSGEWEYRRAKDANWAAAWRNTLEGQFNAVLRAAAPNIPVEFLDPELALCLRKP